MKSIFVKKISFAKSLVLIALSVACTFFIMNYIFFGSFFSQSSSLITTKTTTQNCDTEIKRLNGLSYVKPLMFVDNECESEELAPIKQRINQLIEENKQLGNLISASVYLRSYSKNGWMGINENDKYSPGSLLKVPVLITILKMKEQNPALLEKCLSFDHPFQTNKTTHILSNQIQLGHKYQIKELLTYMIVYSDNNATNLLNTFIDVNVLKKIFTDFGLSAPDWNSNNYPISPKDYSLFMRAIYNATYLSNEDSEFAAELLAHTNFRNGLLRNLPEFVHVAHKFGEGGDSREPELSESAIVYLDNKTYLLTVMTKGKEIKKLEDVLSEISEIIYQSL